MALATVRAESSLLLVELLDRGGYRPGFRGDSWALWGLISASRGEAAE